MASTTPSLISLLRRVNLDDHEEVLDAANATLKKNKKDSEALHVKVVALVKLERYDDALRVLEEDSDSLKGRAQLEKAYALYKLARFGEVECITQTAPQDRGMRHIEGQATYRLEHFGRSAEIYKQLAGDIDAAPEEESDLRINDSANLAQLEWSGQGHLVKKKKASRDDLDAFETTYNAACASIARNELGQASVLLKRARDLCNAETLSDAEKKVELLSITVQQLYVAARLGQEEDVQQLSSEIDLVDISEASTRMISQNNLIASSPSPSNPYLASRLFHSMPNTSKSNQPFGFQSAILRQNAHALDLQTLKYNSVLNSTSRFLAEQDRPSLSAATNTSSVLNAAATAQSCDGKAALKTILPLLTKRPNDIGLILTVVQIYVSIQKTNSAIELLAAFFQRIESSHPDVRHAPGLVAVLVALYNSTGQTRLTRAELSATASYWRSQPASSPASLSFFRAAATSLLSSTDTTDLSLASDLFSIILQADPNDRIAIAGFVASNAISSPNSITDKLEKLTPTSRLTAGVDISSLLAAGVAHPPASSLIPLSKKRPAPETTVQEPLRKKRIRKSRMPKDYDENKTPDPERWLPLRDRSTYRAKSKRGKLKQAAMTQGGPVSDEKVKTEITGVVKSESKGGPASKKKKAKGKK